MTKQDREKLKEEARKWLRASKQYQKERREFGHLRAYLYYDDIEREWLENWEDVDE